MLQQEPTLLHQIFEQQVIKRPSAIAVECVETNQRLTYWELDERAGRLARHLQSLGVGTNDVVAIYMPLCDCLWRPVPDTLKLEEDEVHVWRATLDVKLLELQKLKETLAEEEVARAERHRSQRDHDHFVVRHGLLRAIMGRYLGERPNQLRFTYSAFGKPTLVDKRGLSKICFNVSHSDGLALFAIARGRELGVDLERIRCDLKIECIAESFFSPGELAALRALPPDGQEEAFWVCWTRKEAYIKALGGGLSIPLNQFDVLVVPGKPATLLRAGRNPQAPSRWSLRDLVPGPGYVACLCVEGRHPQVNCWQWPVGVVPNFRVAYY